MAEFVERVDSIWSQLCRGMVRAEENYISSGRLTAPQFWALEWLLKNGPCTMQQLVSGLRMKSSTVTLLVDRLVALRLVGRKRDREDRRVVHVQLSAKGRKVLSDIHRHRKSGVTKVFSPFTPAERALYLGLIEKLLTELPTNEKVTS